VQQNVDQYQAKIFWQSARPLVAGRTYILTQGEREVEATITALKYRENQETGEHLSATRINKGEVALANIATAITISASEQDRFELLDSNDRTPLGYGVFEFALRRATNIRWQTVTIDKLARAQVKQQVPRCIWFTGLSGSGKSTIANLLEKSLYERGFHTYLLDGDNLRHGLNRDLGFTEADRVENIRRVAEVAHLMVDAGLIVLASFISPYRAEREMARKLFSPGEFFEVFVDTPLEDCEKRDVKGLYAKARRGELKNFTGIDSAYEHPEHPELVIDARLSSAEESVAQLLQLIDFPNS